MSVAVDILGRMSGKTSELATALDYYWRAANRLYYRLEDADHREYPLVSVEVWAAGLEARMALEETAVDAP